MFYRSQDQVFTRARHWFEAVCNRTRSIVTVAAWLTVLRWSTLIRAGLVSVLRLTSVTSVTIYKHAITAVMLTTQTRHWHMSGLTVGHILLPHITEAGVTRWREWRHGETRRYPDAILVANIWTPHSPGDAAMILTPGSGQGGSGRLCLISTQEWN